MSGRYVLCAWGSQARLLWFSPYDRCCCCRSRGTSVPETALASLPLFFCCSLCLPLSLLHYPVLLACFSLRRGCCTSTFRRPIELYVVGRVCVGYVSTDFSAPLFVFPFFGCVCVYVWGCAVLPGKRKRLEHVDVNKRNGLTYACVSSA